MKQIFGKIYLAWALIVFNVFLIIFFPFFIIPVMVHQRFGSITFSFIKLWAFIFSKLTFIRYRIHGVDKIDRKKSYIYTCNHTSLLDSPGIALSIPTQWRPLGKKELLKIPIFGYVLKYIAVIVDRSNARSRQESLTNMIRYIKMRISILIFPEGTMNRTNEVLQPFYDGAFRMAIETQTEIMPMVILNAGELCPPTKYTIKPGTIDVYVGQPIPVEGITLKELPILKDRVYNAMKALIDEGALPKT